MDVVGKAICIEGVYSLIEGSCGCKLINGCRSFDGFTLPPSHRPQYECTEPNRMDVSEVRQSTDGACTRVIKLGHGSE